MSVGALMQDPDEVPGAGPGVAPLVPQPVPPMPQMPGMPPGAPAPLLPPPDAAAGAPGASPDPNANLPPDALMQPGPGLQPPPPAAPPATLPNGAIDTRTEEAKTLEGGDQLADQAVQAEQAKGKANAGIADAESKGADAELAIQQQYQKDTQEALQRANQNTQAWMDRAQTDAQKYQSAGLHDYWADKSTGQKVLAGIAIMFGAAGRAEGNPGLTMVQNAIDRDFRMQQAKIEKLKGNLDVDNAMVQGGMSAKQSLLADNQLKKAAALDAAAAQLTSYKLKQGVPLEQAQTDANVVALKQKANATRMETLHAIHAQNVEDARLGIEQERADAMRLRAEKYKTRGAGGGGGGGGGRSDAASQLADMIEKGKDGRPLTQKEMIDAANDLKIPLFGKPSQTTLDSIKKSVAFNRDAARKDEKAGLGDERQLSKEASEWAKQNSLADINKKQRELQSVLEEVKNAPHNALQQALAIEKAVSSARGGAASKQALELALHHLGPKYTSLDDVKNAIINKEIGQKQMDNFIGFMTNQLGTAQKEGKDKYEEFNKYIESQPPEKRAALEAQRGKLFSGFSGFGGSAKATGGEGEQAPVGKVMPDGSVLTFQRNKATGAIRRVLKRPDGSIVPVP